MQIKPFLSLALVALTSLLGACGSLPGSQARPTTQAATTHDRVSSAQVHDLDQRLLAIEMSNRRRQLAERDAYQAGREAASAQTPPKSLACVRLPWAITQSVYYKDFSHVMESVYTTSCLYAVDEWDTEQKARAKPPVPAKPSTKK